MTHRTAESIESARSPPRTSCEAMRSVRSGSLPRRAALASEAILTAQTPVCTASTLTRRAFAGSLTTIRVKGMKRCDSS